MSDINNVREATDFLERPVNLRERRAHYRFLYNSNPQVAGFVDYSSVLKFVDDTGLFCPVGREA